MAYWLIKSEAETWSWDQQVKSGKKGEAWTGVRNAQARNFMREMKKGDLAFFYHSGDERAVVGVVKIVKEAYQDPTTDDERWVVVDVAAIEPVPKPVTLAAIKAEPKLDEMKLVKNSRLSVQPVRPAEWKLVAKMGGLKQ
ncbi:EVE domain-containing protein [Hyphococcus sp.]|uniref:EVE domain-containing protein n=1 Tax=Hyphococcus sp. TaxID=2038636 RepID=UPI00208C84B6|nr:MAG: ubiquinol-cytochrome c reductase [Marinicaulis sp.]